MKFQADIISVNGGCDFLPLAVSLELAASLPLVPSQWFFVKGTDNPADVASRGLSPSKVSDVKTWFNGPDFLWQLEET